MTHKDQSWWAGSSLYQVYPRSFQDARGDGVGDLKGLMQRLDYIEGLGVKGLWLGPIFDSPMRDVGYDVSDYKKISPDYGDLDTFREFLAEVHRRSLKLVMDLVLNHTSDQHIWFEHSRKDPSGPYADYYVWQDGEPGLPPNNWLSAFGGSAWSWCEKRKQHYYHHFLKEQPDLNFHNPRVQEELLSVAQFWLDMGVDGFRLDACNCYFHNISLLNNPPRENPIGEVQDANNPYFSQQHVYDKSQPEALSFLKKLRNLADSYENRFLIGEIFCDQEQKTLAEYTGGGGPLHSAYNFSLLKNNRSPGLFESAISEFHSISPSTSWALSNHDVQRVVSRWPESIGVSQAAKCYMNLLSALPGTIIVYQGEELGLTEALVPLELRHDPFGKNMQSNYPGRDGCRTPMPWTASEALMGFTGGQTSWLPLCEQHRPLAVDQQAHRDNSTLTFSQKLITWRQQNSELIERADIKFLRDDDDAVIFFRTETSGQKILVFSSFTTEPMTLSVEPGGEILSDLSSGVELMNSTQLRLAPGGFGRVQWKGSKETYDCN